MDRSRNGIIIIGGTETQAILLSKQGLSHNIIPEKVTQDQD
jgi:hypothetical protein